MSNLGLRTITGAIGASLMIAAILFREYTFLLLLSLITVLGMMEFYRHCEKDGIRPQKMFGILMAALLFIPPLLNSAAGISYNLIPLLFILPYIVFIRELYTKAEKPFTNIAYTLLGVIYLAVPMFLFYLVSFQGIDKDHYHPENILGCLFIVWSNDSGAYFSGRFLGKRKLFERISPKKTWEGFFGGVLLALVAAWIVSGYYTNLTRTDWMVIGGIISTTGTLGDLVESLFKRSIHIKDSGALLPGHGGILDRFDALFIAVPFIFFYLFMFA